MKPVNQPELGHDHIADLPLRAPSFVEVELTHLLNTHRPPEDQIRIPELLQRQLRFLKRHPRPGDPAQEEDFSPDDEVRNDEDNVTCLSVCLNEVVLSACEPHTNEFYLIIFHLGFRKEKSHLINILIFKIKL